MKKLFVFIAITLAFSAYTKNYATTAKNCHCKTEKCSCVNCESCKCQA